MKPLFTVWKEDPPFDPKLPWKVQMPRGLMSFRLKRYAVIFADAHKKMLVSEVPITYWDIAGKVRRI